MRATAAFKFHLDIHLFKEDHHVYRLIQERLTMPDQAKAVGTLGARSGHDDIVDVTVVEGAVRRHDAVVTSNPTHIRKIADATRSRLTIERV